LTSAGVQTFRFGRAKAKALDSILFRAKAKALDFIWKAYDRLTQQNGFIVKLQKSEAINFRTWPTFSGQKFTDQKFFENIGFFKTKSVE
jgi:hypothetical protein